MNFPPLKPVYNWLLQDAVPMSMELIQIITKLLFNQKKSTSVKSNYWRMMGLNIYGIFQEKHPLSHFESMKKCTV